MLYTPIQFAHSLYIFTWPPSNPSSSTFITIAQRNGVDGDLFPIFNSCSRIPSAVCHCPAHPVCVCLSVSVPQYPIGRALIASLKQGAQPLPSPNRKSVIIHPSSYHLHTRSPITRHPPLPSKPSKGVGVNLLTRVPYPLKNRHIRILRIAAVNPHSFDTRIIPFKFIHSLHPSTPEFITKSI